MGKMDYILRSMNVLNGLLIVSLGVAAYDVISPVSSADVRLSLPSQGASGSVLSDKQQPPASPQTIDYAIISDQNLFHPERKIPPEKKDAKEIPRPEVVLYGTLITSESSVAFLEDKKTPKTTPGRGKRQIMLHKGEQLSGYVLQQIEPNRIVLAKGEDKITVMLEAGDKRKESAQDGPGAAPAGMPGSQASAAANLPKNAAPALPMAQQKAAPAGAKVADAPGIMPTSRQAALQEVMNRKQMRQVQ